MFLILDILGIGRSVAFPGHPLGSGLTPEAAKARIFVFLFSFQVKHFFSSVIIYGISLMKLFIFFSIYFFFYDMILFKQRYDELITVVCAAGVRSFTWNSCWIFID